MEKRKVWNPNIANEARKAWKQWKKWQSWNPNWKPKKGISLVNAELKLKWYEPADKKDIEATYMSMIQLWEDELIELWMNKDKPMLVRVLAKNMLSWKWFDIMERMLDRGIGKATQKEEVSWEIKVTKVTIWLPNEEE